MDKTRPYPTLLPHEVCITGALIRSMERGNVAIQRPEWQKPTFWSWPLTLTKFRCISRTASDWFTFLTLAPRDQYKTVLKSYIAETLNPREDTGIEFRLVFDNNIRVPQVNLNGTKVTLNKDPVDTWPLHGRKCHLVLRDDQRMYLQVRNTTFQDQQVFGGFFGYFYEDVDASERGTRRSSGGGSFSVAVR